MFKKILAPIRKYLKQRVVRTHYDLFQWHCDTFYPIRDEISDAEWHYLETCFQLPNSLMEVPESGYDEYSYYTYSHRVRGEDVNSSRFAYGTLLHVESALEAAKAVIDEKDIQVDPYFLESPSSFFYGLGWDLMAGHFKVYFREQDLSALPQAQLQTLIDESLPTYQSEGLVSFTYSKGEEGYTLHEEKVYIYPNRDKKEDGEIFPGTKGRVLMSTSKRGILTQYDVSQPKQWRERLNQTGKDILQKYHKKGYTLDTIVMKDADNFTLYFPEPLLPFSR